MGYDPIENGYIELACAIAEDRAGGYKTEYFGWLLSTQYYRLRHLYSYGAVKKQERRLRKSPTCLDDGQIAQLQRQAERNPAANGVKKRILRILKNRLKSNAEQEKPKAEKEIFKEVSSITEIPIEILHRWYTAE